MMVNRCLESIDNLRFSKIIYGSNIYQNYVGIGRETSMGKHLLLPSFNGNLTHTPSANMEQESAKGKQGMVHVLEERLMYQWETLQAWEGPKLARGRERERAKMCIFDVEKGQPIKNP